MGPQFNMSVVGHMPQEQINIDPHALSAEHFDTYAALRLSMTAAEEAMLDLGPTMAALTISGATAHEVQAFLSIYGAALLRRGKLRQLCISAESQEIEHLVPPVAVDEPLPVTHDAPACAESSLLNRTPLLVFLGRIVRRR